MTIPPAPYLPTDRGDVVESTPLALAGWYADGQHGGVVSALLGRAIESVPSLEPMETARLTVELFRVVPIVPLRATSRIIRQGKKIQVVEASLFDPSDTELARAVGLRLRRADLALPAEALTPPLDLPGPDAIDPPEMERWGIGGDEKILYHRQAIEVREIGRGFGAKGPGAMWTRLVKPLVEGEGVSALSRAIIPGDFVNGLSRLVEPDRFVFMNADLTIHLHRLPVGEWVGVDAVSRYNPIGRGVASGRLFDTAGEIGRSTQTLFLAPAGPEVEQSTTVR